VLACSQLFPQYLAPYEKIRAYCEHLRERPSFLLTWPKPKPTLFHDPVSRSNRVMWFLEEAELVDQVQIKEVKLRQGEHKTPEFLKLNPAGQVPALVEPDGFALSESIAICLYLLDRFGKTEEWIPNDPKLRGQCFKFLFLAAGSADSYTYDAIVHLLFTPPDKLNQNYFQELNKKWESSVATPLETLLENQEWLLGNKISLADICLGFTLVSSGRMGWNDKFSNLRNYVSRLMQRPAFLKVFPQPPDPIVPPKKDLSKIEKEARDASQVPLEKIVSNPGGDFPNIVVYHVPQTRSTRIMWLLKEIGEDILSHVKIETITWEFLKTKEYSEINPNRLVPAATINSINMFESGAIVRYVCEILLPDHPVTKTLFPSTWTKENWIRHYVYSYWTIVHLDKEMISNFFGFSRVAGKITGKVEKWFKKVVMPKVEADLGDNQYINGNTFTCTDIFLGYSLWLAFNLELFTKNSKLGQYVTRLIARDTFASLVLKPQK